MIPIARIHEASLSVNDRSVTLPKQDDSFLFCLGGQKFRRIYKNLDLPQYFCMVFSGILMQIKIPANVKCFME